MHQLEKVTLKHQSRMTRMTAIILNLFKGFSPRKVSSDSYSPSLYLNSLNASNLRTTGRLYYVRLLYIKYYVVVIAAAAAAN